MLDWMLSDDMQPQFISFGIESSFTIFITYLVSTVPGTAHQATSNIDTGGVNTYTTSRLRVNYLCIFLLNTVDKLAFYMHVFLIYVCLQKHCL